MPYAPNFDPHECVDKHPISENAPDPFTMSLTSKDSGAEKGSHINGESVPITSSLFSTIKKRIWTGNLLRISEHTRVAANLVSSIGQSSTSADVNLQGGRQLCSGILATAVRYISFQKVVEDRDVVEYHRRHNYDTSTESRASLPTGTNERRWINEKVSSAHNWR